jgi:hypothetical protein
LTANSEAGKKAPMAVFVRTLAWCWASPNTLVGLLLAVLCGTRPRWHEGVIEAQGRGLEKLLGHRAQAITLGHVILARDVALLEFHRDHERRHVRQYECLGPFFLPVYLTIGAWVWLRGGRPYRDHPLEIQAGLDRNPTGRRTG